MKSKLGAVNIKGFLADHVEKVVLGLVTAGILALIYSGYSSEGISAAKLPDKLEAAVKGAEDNIQLDKTMEVAAKRLPDQDTFPEKAKEAETKIELTNYRMATTWRPLDFPPEIKRTDPVLEPVIQLIADSGYGAIGETMKVQLPSAPAPATPTAPGSGKPAESAAPLLTAPLDEDNTQLAEDERTIPDENMQILVTLPQASGSKTRGAYFASVRGLLPLRKQAEHYRTAFAAAKDYQPDRDYFPRYLWMDVQRAEIRNGQQSDWVTVSVKKNKDFLMEWGGPNTEQDPVDAVFTKPNTVTHSLPTILLKNISSLASHPEIDRQQEEMIARAQAEAAAAEREQNPEDDGTDAPTAEDLEDQGMGGGYGGEGSYGMQGGYGMRGGMPGGYGMRGGGYGMPGGYGREGRGGMMGMGMMGMGMDYTNPYASFASGDYGDELDLEKVPEFLLYRFVDYTVEPGRSYRYRVRVWIDDPNDATTRAMRTAHRNLDQTVTDRLRKLPKKRKYRYRVPEWSEPSGIVTINSGYQLLAGKATASRAPGVEPRAKAMILKFDSATGIEAPMEVIAMRGTVFAGLKKDVEAILPDKMYLKTRKDEVFSPRLQVLDIRGGAAFPGDHKDKSTLLSPCEMLVMDANGQLSVRDEVQDQQTYEIHSFPKATEEEGTGYGYGSGAGYGSPGPRGR